METVICPKCGGECYAHELEDADACNDCLDCMGAAERAKHTKIITDDEGDSYSPAQIGSW